MLNGRLYRAAFVPFLVALAVAAFSLTPLPAPLGSTLAPEAFEGAPAMAQLATLARRFPQRRPGSGADRRMAAYVAAQLRGLGGTAGGGFSVRSYSFDAQTIDGEHTLTNVIAQRPGSTEATPILIVAHRDAAARSAQAELSATAALIELAHVFANRETKRTIVLASTSGGSGGGEGAAQLISELHGPFDAAVVLGDLAGVRTRIPIVVPFSEGPGLAPLLLQRTLASAISQTAGIQPGAPSAISQLVHLVMPLAAGEQGVLQARGIPAVLVSAAGERGAGARERVSSERLEGLGRAVLSAVDALDTAPDVPATTQTGLVLSHQQLPGWALRLLVLTLMLPVLVAGADGVARLRRRGVRVAHLAGWSVSCAAPFFACALFAYVLGFLGVLGGSPGAAAVLPSAMPVGASAVIALLTSALVFVLAWMGWASLVRTLRWGTRPDPDAAGLATAMVALVLALLVWIGNPLQALLLLAPLHVFLVLSTPQLRPPHLLGSLALLALAATPYALVLLFYALALGAGPVSVAWGALLLLAGGHIGPVSALLWSIAFGCLAAAGLLALAADIAPEAPAAGAPREIRFMSRGPLTYAGPGSLGGTESALRR